MADDLQATGTQAPEPDPSSILKALSEGQGMPQSPLNTWAATMSGYGAGMQGKENPVIGQQLQAQEANRRSQMAMYSVLQGMQQSKRLQQESQRAILQALPDDNEDIYRYKVKGLLGMAAQAGAPPPPEIADAMINRKLDPKQLPEIAQLMYMGMSPEDIARSVKGAPSLEALTRFAQNPDKLFQAFGLDPAALKIKQLESETKGLELLYKKYGIEPKSPQGQAMLSLALNDYQKPFVDLTPEQQADIVKKGPLTAGPLTAKERDALTMFGPQLGVKNPDLTDMETRQKAFTMYTKFLNDEAIKKAGVTGQLTNMGAIYRHGSTQINDNLSRLRGLDDLITRMDRLVEEGKELGMTNNPKALNAIIQQLKYQTAGSKPSKAAEWYQAFNTMDAQFAQVAQAIEGISGNRLAVPNVTRALAYHPKQTDPYNIQRRVVNELKTAKEAAYNEQIAGMAKLNNDLGAAAGYMGIPFIMGQQGQRGWSAEPE